jgi:hypothetical protein
VGNPNNKTNKPTIWGPGDSDFGDVLLLGLPFTTLLVFSSILEITILCPDLLVF